MCAVQAASRERRAKSTKQRPAGIAFVQEFRALHVAVCQLNTIAVESESANHTIAVQPMVIPEVLGAEPCGPVQIVDAIDKGRYLSVNTIDGKVIFPKFCRESRIEAWGKV